MPKDHAHSVIEEHRITRHQAMEERLAAHCTCKPKHSAAMVIRSLSVCAFAADDRECDVLDAVIWALDDIHATLWPDHETDELVN